MGRYGLKLTPEMCSPLGQVILEYLNKHELSLSQLAKQSGISQPGLRLACLKGTTPTDTTLKKLAPPLGRELSELHYLVYKGKVDDSKKNTLEEVFNRVQGTINLLISDLAANLDFEKPDENEVVEATLRLIKDLKIDSAIPSKTAERLQNNYQK